MLKHENIVEMKEVIVCRDSDMEDEDVDANKRGFSLGDVFIVFEFVPLSLSQILLTQSKANVSYKKSMS